MSSLDLYQRILQGIAVLGLLASGFDGWHAFGWFVLGGFLMLLWTVAARI
jgi:hypothetical protein